MGSHRERLGSISIEYSMGRVHHILALKGRVSPCETRWVSSNFAKLAAKIEINML